MARVSRSAVMGCYFTRVSQMSGYEEYNVDPPKKLTEQANSKNFATDSLCCLTTTNPFREKVIQIFLNKYRLFSITL